MHKRSRSHRRDGQKRPHDAASGRASVNFCAGVDRAIRIVELAIAEIRTRPIYVRHEIVHNRFVVRTAGKDGAVFIDDLAGPRRTPASSFLLTGYPNPCPPTPSAATFSISTPPARSSPGHVEAERHFKTGREIILIGHTGHPEVEGTMGQLPDGAIALVQTVADARSLFAARSGSHCLHHANHVVGRRHRRNRRRTAHTLSGHRRTTSRRHLLRDHKQTGRDESRRPTCRHCYW